MNRICPVEYSAHFIRDLWILLSTTDNFLKLVTLFACCGIV